NYIVEWRVVNAAEYGAVQRRRRTFIFAYKADTNFAKSLKLKKDTSLVSEVLDTNGFFAKSFPVKKIETSKIETTEISNDIANVSDNFSFGFCNSGIMFNGNIYTVKSTPVTFKSETIGDIIEKDDVDKKYFIPDERLYFTDPASTHSDETETELPAESRHTWQYIKGAKRKYRIAANGHKYIYSEGAIPMIDEWNKPARTMLTSEGSFNRSTHIVRDFTNQQIRILTPKETERIQGFPDDWTNTGMPEKFRYFCMGNALVVPLISRMEKSIENIFLNEP
ncbi:MAG: DNA cytosine methyltransferase, partial [Treponema sp.]|nr:DNA cytosine methyltransferase [Treponema sp.]